MWESATGSSQRLCVIQLCEAGEAGGQESRTSPSLNKDPAGHNSPLSELQIAAPHLPVKHTKRGASV